MIQQNPHIQQLQRRYKSVFSKGQEAMNQFKVQLKLKDPNSQPVFMKHRLVLFTLKEAVGKELDRLEKEGVLEKITHSDWALPVVAVPNGDGQLRLCGDYKVTLNPFLDVDQYPLSKPDELFSTLA